MTSDRFLYFAYGSNLLSARLRERTPSARAVGVAVLPGYALRWHKAGADGSGKCDVFAVSGDASRVQGVVYDIAWADKPALHAAEALGVGYGEQQVRVQMGQEWVTAWVYVALERVHGWVPYHWYKDLVVAGAREHGLDADYIRALEAVPARDDADAARDLRHRALVGVTQSGV